MRRALCRTRPSSLGHCQKHCFQSSLRSILLLGLGLGFTSAGSTGNTDRGGVPCLCSERRLGILGCSYTTSHWMLFACRTSDGSRRR